jgi:hypothetical protein
MSAFSMDTNIFGMAVRGRTIYYSAADKGLKMLNLNDKSVSDIINSIVLPLTAMPKMFVSMEKADMTS